MPEFDLLNAGKFGGCPECAASDGYMNVGRLHFFYCDAHKTAWYVGMNVFSSWESENKEVWEANMRRIEKHFVPADPVFNPFLGHPCEEKLKKSIRERTLGYVIHWCSTDRRKYLLGCMDGRLLEVSWTAWDPGDKRTCTKGDDHADTRHLH
jgi:hypothetical protein